MKVELFGKSWCAYCERAKELLEERGQEYTYIDVEENEWALSEFRRRTPPGTAKVPQLFFDGVHQPNGYDGLRTYYKELDLAAKEAENDS